MACPLFQINSLSWFLMLLDISLGNSRLTQVYNCLFDSWEKGLTEAVWDRCLSLVLPAPVTVWFCCDLFLAASLVMFQPVRNKDFLLCFCLSHCSFGAPSLTFLFFFFATVWGHDFISTSFHFFFKKLFMLMFWVLCTLQPPQRIAKGRKGSAPWAKDFVWHLDNQQCWWSPYHVRAKDTGPCSRRAVFAMHSFFSADTVHIRQIESVNWG